MDISKLVKLIIYVLILLKNNLINSKTINDSFISKINYKVNQINNTKNLYKVRDYDKSTCIHKVQFFKGKSLLKIKLHYSDGADNIFQKYYYFNKNQLIMVQKHRYHFENGIHSGYTLNKSQHSIKTIYFKNNHIHKIIIDGNPKVFSKKNENEYIKNELNEYLHLSKIFKLPKYRTYSGGEYGFLNEYSLSGN